MELKKTMGREKDVLTILDKNNDISQRELAKKAGVSLGTVNSLVKKCVKKGLLKIERLNSRNLRYILTPAGMKEKMKKTLSYVKRSYKAIVQLQEEVCQLAREKKEQNREIWLLGDKDEIYELVISSLNMIDVNYIYIDSLARIDERKGEQEITVFYWEPENLEYETSSEVEFINLLQVSEPDSLK
ncbi:MAG: winged helix-turn-helix transcriptional regulator [Bacillota bacterium]